MLGLCTSLFELQNMLTKIPFLVSLFKSGNCGKKRKTNGKTLNTSRTEKAL